MLKKLLVIPLSLLLFSCNTDETPTTTAATEPVAANNYSAADGYFFETYDHVRTNMAVSFVFYPNHRAVQIAGAKNGIVVKDGYELEAFSFWTKGNASCQVHIVDPRIKYDPSTLGHEITHCIFGEFHPSRNK